MVKFLAIAILQVVLITGCSAIVTPVDDDYQLGDTSQSLAALRGEYCTEVTPLARLGVRKLIVDLGGVIPKDFCQ